MQDKNKLLFDAVAKGDMDALHQLIADGADVNARDEEGRTPAILDKLKGLKSDDNE